MSVDPSDRGTSVAEESRPLVEGSVTARTGSEARIATQGSRPRGDASVRNRFVSQVAISLRQNQPRLSAGPLTTVNSETVGGRPFVRLWFTTAGCTHDRRGRCTMCNYGTSEPADAESIVHAAALDLSRSGCTHGTLLVSPSGSMFDEREVDPPTRRQLLTLAASTDFERILVETRPETITDAVLSESIALLPGKQLEIEIGLESSDPWVLRWCVNKGLHLEQVVRALDLCAAYGATSIVNVSLGTAFLTEVEAIADAVNTTRWAFAQGATEVVVFPLSVRGWTVLHHMYERGRYRPVSLWSLVEVLRRLGQAAAARVSISWYRDYNAADDDYSSSPLRVLAAPTTCERCVSDVLERLDGYRDSQDFTIITDLSHHTCSCRQEWLSGLAQAPTQPLSQRVQDEYRALAVELGLGFAPSDVPDFHP